jgi:hypothetical protein
MKHTQEVGAETLITEAKPQFYSFNKLYCIISEGKAS